MCIRCTCRSRLRFLAYFSLIDPGPADDGLVVEIGRDTSAAGMTPPSDQCELGRLNPDESLSTMANVRPGTVGNLTP